jgi:hypothetical protein
MFRYFLERLLRDVVASYLSKSGLIYETVEQLTAKAEVKAFVKVVNMTYPTMSTVDKLLTVPEVFVAVAQVGTFTVRLMVTQPDALMLCAARTLSLQVLGLAKGVVYPKIPNDLLYGALSLAIHSPVANELVYASTAPAELKRFYDALAAREVAQAVEFDVMESEAGEGVASNIVGGAAT